MTTATIRAVGYTRVSTKEQVVSEDGDAKVSLREQRADIEAHCKKKGYQLVDWYSDEGYSGATKNRPDFKRMAKDAAAGGFDVIISWKFDRLARGMWPYAVLNEMLQAGIEIECVKDAVDRKMLGIYAGVAAFELENIKERTRMGMRGKFKDGTFSGHVKYGYRLAGPEGKKKPVIYEPEAAVVRRIFNDYISIGGTGTIATMLRRDGIFTREGKTFNPDTVWKIISDLAYTGTTHYGKTQVFYRDNGEKDVKVTRKMAAETWIEIHYPRLIDEATWEAAQLQRKNPTRNRHKARYNVPFMLKGILWCGDCGHKYSTSAVKSYSTYVLADGMKKRYLNKNPRRRYQCAAGYHMGLKCSRRLVGASSLEALVWDEIKQFHRKRSQVKALITKRKRLLQESGTLPELEKARDELEKVRQKEAVLLDQYLEGSFDRDLLDLKKKQIRDLREYYEAEVRRLEHEAADASNTIDALSNFYASAARITERFDSMNDAEKEQAVRLLVSRITVTKGEISIVMALNAAKLVTHTSPTSPPSTWPCV